jgi:predicted nucleic-acid-binding Zn-ribbon protein
MKFFSQKNLKSSCRGDFVVDFLVKTVEPLFYKARRRMKQSGACPKCNSHNLIKNVRIPDNGYRHFTVLAISFIVEKMGWFSARSVSGEIRAWVCGHCGYTELYTENYKELLEGYQEWWEHKDE